MIRKIKLVTAHTRLHFRADNTMVEPSLWFELNIYPFFYRTDFFKYIIFGQILLSIFLIHCFKIDDQKFKVCMPWSVNCSTWTNLSWINWAPKRLRKLRWRHPPQVLRTRRFLNSIHGLLVGHSVQDVLFRLEFLSSFHLLIVWVFLKFVWLFYLPT